MRVLAFLFISLVLFQFGVAQPDDETIAKQGRVVNDIEVGDMIVDIEPHEAIKYYEKALNTAKKKNDSLEIAAALVKMGDANYILGSYGESLENHSMALGIYVKLGVDSLEAHQLSKIGSVYYFSEQNELALALKYYEEAFSKFNSLGLTADAAFNLNYSGYVEWARGNEAKSLEIHQEALKMFEAIGDQKGMATSLSDIGFTLNSLGRFDEALNYHFKALELEKELGEELMQIPTLNNIGISYQNLKKYELAIKYSSESLAMAEERQATNRIVEASRTLAETYEKMGDLKNAIRMLKKFKSKSDSLLNLNEVKKLTQQSMKNEFEKTKTQMMLEEEKREVLQQAELKRQKLLGDGMIIVTLFIGILALILYRSYHAKNKSHEELSRMNAVILNQNTLVERKNRDITDSINYAKRLQEAILPNENRMKRKLADVFTFYLPKDIVSGDFYWLETIDEYTFVAVADCTGHGIPGAMVSMVCYSALTRSIREFDLRNPNEILDNCREMIVRTFDGGNHEVHDGMDISLCCINRKQDRLLFAGAHNSIIHIPRKSILSGNPELNIITADKQPVGSYVREQPFTQTEVHIADGDLFYLFTDGYVDQFGGVNNEKFKQRRLRELITDICSKPLNEQYRIIEKTFKDWKGKRDQIDDVCVMCFQV
ncbi:MAG: tetratricopeptide repeat protein [Flavobacteriales bacterium]|nr:tetratricopeptide repeat protein [Flavobacteriales bacterium]